MASGRRGGRRVVVCVGLLMVLTGLLATWIGAVGTTLYVDDDTCPAGGSGTLANPYCHIQDAVCVGLSGDTVSVAPGTYHEAVRMKPGVSLISQGGAAVTTIDASGQPCTDNNYCAKRTGNQCTVVTFASGHTLATVLDGFTLTGGAGLIQTTKVAGGGIYVFSSATIVNNVITNNVISGPLPQGGDLRGAGVYIATGQPVVSNNTITGNRAIPPSGTNTQLSYGYGGGVWVGFASAPVVTNNVITGNVAGDPNAAYSLGAGGGVVVWPGSGTQGPLIDRNLIADNFTDTLGGGVSLNSLPNTAAQAVVTNNVIVGNRGTEGGGVYTYFNKSTTMNNTIVDNEGFLGSGVYTGQSDVTLPVVITNNIIQGNRLRAFGDGGGIYSLDLSSTFDPVISYNDLWGNDRNQCGGELSDADCIGVSGNFSADPQFVDLMNRDFHLTAGSPAVDTGTSSGAPATDFDGMARGYDGDGTPNSPQAGDVDVGAYELTGGCVPSAEICDGIDNDCNGTPDDGLGQSTCGVGACQVTTDNCIGGVTQTCLPGTPTTEVCDGIDNDCNGTPDDGLGQSTCGVGACQVTTDNCIGGVTQTCLPGTPATEVCDGIDNDCNGTPDDGLGQSTCGVGACQVTTDNCIGGVTQTCLPGTPTAEVCDGIDNDCNGTPDDGLGQSTCGVGACQVTTDNCIGGVTQTCLPGTPTTEVCDGMDNNCNGNIDEGFPDTDNDGIKDCIDPDDDNDTVPDAADCAPLDPTAFGVPVEVNGIDVVGILPTIITYSLQNVGIGTDYQIVVGSVSDLLQTRDFTTSGCLTSSTQGEPWADGSGAPDPGDARYYLVRAVNHCGTGSFGSSLRDGTEGAGGACPLGGGKRKGQGRWYLPN